METRSLTIISRLSNQELLARVQHLARHERQATASLVAHLAELDERQLYLGQGCASLFAYCTEILHLSEHAAYGRIQAARVARRFPVVLEKLESGDLNLTTLVLLSPQLTASNHVELFEAAKHQRKRRVEELVAALRPQPDLPSSIRKLPVGSGSHAPDGVRIEGVATADLFGVGSAGAKHVETRPETRLGPQEEAPRLEAAPAASTQRAIIAPLAPERYKFQCTLGAETHDKLRRAQELLRHQIPNGDPAAIIDRALTMLLAHVEKKRLGATARPRPTRATRPGSRHIPAQVRRTTWQRDEGRCGFVSDDGRRCNEPGFVQFHHVNPYGDGGEASVENIELRCRAHNQYEADLYYGPRNENRKRRNPEVRESAAIYGSGWPVRAHAVATPAAACERPDRFC